MLTETYCAYLVRFWRNDRGWHGLAKNVQTGEEHHFATVEACLSFLQAAISTPNDDISFFEA